MEEPKNCYFPINTDAVVERQLLHALSCPNRNVRTHVHVQATTVWTCAWEAAAVVWYAMLIAVLVCLSRENP